MQKQYYVDRIHKKILYLDEEFQHHGIEGQRWGVITRNVGVNYVPVGQSGHGNATSRKLSDDQKTVIRRYVISSMGSMPSNCIDLNSKVLKKYYDRISSNKKFQKNGKMSNFAIKSTIDRVNYETVKSFKNGLKQFEKENPNLKGWASYNAYRQYLMKNNSIVISAKDSKGPKLLVSMVDDGPLELGIDYGDVINITNQTLLMNP